jgi:hypothetical protein
MVQMVQLALQAQLVLLAHRVFKDQLGQLALQAQLVLQEIRVPLSIPLARGV